MASSLDIQFDVISNMAEGCHIRLTFTNKGQDTITSGKWKIYFSSIKPISIRADPIVSRPTKITVSHINGYLHKMKPTKHFSNLPPDRKIKFDLSAQGAIAAKTDVMPNWYIAAPGLKPRIIKCTKGEQLRFVGAFDSPSKWKRYELDSYDPFTPKKRFDMNKIADLKEPGQLIIPTPLVLKNRNALKTVDLNDGEWIVVSEKDLEEEGQYLAGMFQDKAKFESVCIRGTATTSVVARVYHGLHCFIVWDHC